MSTFETLRPAVYRVTETGLDGASFCHVRGWDAVRADRMVNRMIRRADTQIARGEEPGFLVDPATDATGRLVLRRRHLSFGEREGEVRERWQVWELEPVTRPKLSVWQAEDLEAVANSRYWPGGDFTKPQQPGAMLHMTRVRAQEEPRISCTGMYSIPPAAWRRLVLKGWASFSAGVVRPLEPFRITVAGRVALALRRHQTRTSSPHGYIKAADHPNPAIANSGMVGLWRKGGRIYDGTSFVVCSAGCFEGRCLDRRYLAQAEARAHRAEAVMLTLGASKEQAKRAGQRAKAGPRGGAVA
ncbi:hypothetical protein ACFV42_46550 [Streptomyces solisilvae]|uniref:hypothetical protein n=1 Tax=Streptomyces malaysiensis TaxID=92644 RepID=UPI0036973D61